MRSTAALIPRRFRYLCGKSAWRKLRAWQALGRVAGLNPLTVEKRFIENPIVTKLKDGSFVAVYDTDEPNAIGYTFSPDGIHWSSGQHLLVQEGKGVWASEVRTPLGLIPEPEKDSFTLFYTANEKVSGMQPDGNGINRTPGSMGLVEVRLRKQ